VIEGEAGARVPFMVCCIGADVKNVKGFNHGKEAFVDNVIKVSIIGMEKGDGSFIRGFGLVNEDLTCGF